MCFGLDHNDDEKTTNSEENSMRIKARLLDFEKAKKFRKQSEDSIEMPLAKNRKGDPEKPSKADLLIFQRKKENEKSKPKLSLSTPGADSTDQSKIQTGHGDRPISSGLSNLPSDISLTSNSNKLKSKKDSREKMLSVPTSTKDKSLRSKGKKRKKGSNSTNSDSKISELPSKESLIKEKVKTMLLNSSPNDIPKQDSFKNVGVKTQKIFPKEKVKEEIDIKDKLDNSTNVLSPNEDVKMNLVKEEIDIKDKSDNSTNVLSPNEDVKMNLERYHPNEEKMKTQLEISFKMDSPKESVKNEEKVKPILEKFILTETSQETLKVDDKTKPKLEKFLELERPEIIKNKDILPYNLGEDKSSSNIPAPNPKKPKTVIQREQQICLIFIPFCQHLDTTISTLYFSDKMIPTIAPANRRACDFNDYKNPYKPLSIDQYNDS